MGIWWSELRVFSTMLNDIFVHFFVYARLPEKITILQPIFMLISLLRHFKPQISFGSNQSQVNSYNMSGRSWFCFFYFSAKKRRDTFSSQLRLPGGRLFLILALSSSF